MAVTISERPEGYILSDYVFPDSTSITDSAGDALFDFPSNPHGLATGNYVFINSSISDYNGYWAVTVISATSFKLQDGAGFVQFTIDATGQYFTYASALGSAHGWSAVHLPITYRLSNNLYPVNSSDTSRNVNSVQDAHGYTVILLSGSLGSGVNSYDFVKLTLPNDTELSGVYQIIEFVSPTVLIINLAYSTDNNFTSATALKHYNNYNFVVRVYAGINASHEWTAQKPYELAATKLYTPDDNNEAFFSINEILKSYVETRNNLSLPTLPNNIDFWANFYIEVAEQYDDSDGYTFGTFTGNFTSDQSTFEGTAVNAKLEFKNLYSGFMSQYIMGFSDSKFLTLFDEPVLFEGIYQDVSFIKFTDSDYTIVKQYYLNGNAGLQETEAISGDSGVYRVQLSANCDYDRVDITLLTNIDVVPGTGELLLTGFAPTAIVGPP